MFERANAKINLYLNVLNKRSDGYHNIQSLMCSLDFADLLKVDSLSKTKAGLGSLDIEYYGPYKSVFENLDQNSNTLYKAFWKFFENKSFNAICKLTLCKNIPSEAGLGGGSSDAAALLRLLNKAYGLYSKKQLMRIAAGIGADVPFCLQKKTAVCTGIGETINTVSYKKRLPVILIKPNVSINTKEAYSAVKKKQFDVFSNQWFKNRLFDNDLNDFFNIFEEHAFQKYPELVSVKNMFYENGALFSLMSGSGSTMFGLFENDTLARKAYKALSSTYDGNVIYTKVVTY